MKIVKKIIYSIFFSVSGPFIIIFGTFSGLILSIETVFGVTVDHSYYRCLFWLYFAYLMCITINLGLRTFDNDAVKSEKDKATALNTLKLANLPDRRKSWVLFFGGYPTFVEWLLKRYGITLYGVFARPEHWTEYPEEQEEYPIIRMAKAGKSIEIRFPKYLGRQIYIRGTKADSNDYETFRTESLWDWKILFFLAPIQFILQILKW